MRSQELETMQFPQELKETIERVYGAKGRRWLTQLPSLLCSQSSLWISATLPIFGLIATLAVVAIL